jgi:hypothetical protein
MIHTFNIPANSHVSEAVTLDGTPDYIHSGLPVALILHDTVPAGTELPVDPTLAFLVSPDGTNFYRLFTPVGAPNVINLAPYSISMQPTQAYITLDPDLFIGIKSIKIECIDVPMVMNEDNELVEQSAVKTFSLVLRPR